MVYIRRSGGLNNHESTVPCEATTIITNSSHLHAAFHRTEWLASCIVIQPLFSEMSCLCPSLSLNHWTQLSLSWTQFQSCTNICCKWTCAFSGTGSIACFFPHFHSVFPSSSLPLFIRSSFNFLINFSSFFLYFLFFLAVFMLLLSFLYYYFLLFLFYLLSLTLFSSVSSLCSVLFMVSLAVTGYWVSFPVA